MAFEFTFDAAAKRIATELNINYRGASLVLREAINRRKKFVGDLNFADVVRLPPLNEVWPLEKLQKDWPIKQ